MNFTIRLLRVLSIVAIVIGALFKIQHWSGASLLLVSGFAGIALTFVADFVIEERGRHRKP